MEKFKGTQGDWVINATENGWYRIENSPLVPNDESRANRKLIAASPDLLEALIQCQQHLALILPDITNEKRRYGMTASINLASEAIAKATQTTGG